MLRRLGIAGSAVIILAAIPAAAGAAQRAPAISCPGGQSGFLRDFSGIGLTASPPAGNDSDGILVHVYGSGAWQSCYGSDGSIRLLSAPTKCYTVNTSNQVYIKTCQSPLVPSQTWSKGDTAEEYRNGYSGTLMRADETSGDPVMVGGNNNPYWLFETTPG